MHIDIAKVLVYLIQARDIYEEAVQTVITVRDFTQVFDAYAQFEKNLISAKMESMEEEGPTEEGKLSNDDFVLTFSTVSFDLDNYMSICRICHVLLFFVSKTWMAVKEDRNGRSVNLNPSNFCVQHLVSL
jgi:hypothetical protein